MNVKLSCQSKSHKASVFLWPCETSIIAKVRFQLYPGLLQLVVSLLWIVRCCIRVRGLAVTRGYDRLIGVIIASPYSHHHCHATTSHGRSCYGRVLKKWEIFYVKIGYEISNCVGKSRNLEKMEKIKSRQKQADLIKYNAYVAREEDRTWFSPKSRYLHSTLASLLKLLSQKGSLFSTELT